MKSEIKNLGKHTIIYGIGIILSKIASFIMLPIYTRFLTPADYGILELLTITTDVISMIVGLGLAATVLRYYSKYDDQEEKNNIISTTFIMMLILSFIITTLCVLLAGKFSLLIYGSDKYTYYFKLSFIILFLQSGIEIPITFIRVRQNSILFVLISLCKLILQLSLNIYFIVILKMGVTGILFSSIISSIAIGVYLTIYTVRRVGISFSPRKSMEILRFGYPLIFWSIGSFILTFSDRYFLNIYSDLETVGTYALAYKFGFLLTALAFFPFSQIWEPQRFEIVKQGNALLIFKKVFLYLNIILISISFVIAIFIKDFLNIMADISYLEAYRIVPIILFAYLLQTWTAFCNIGIFLKEKTKLYAFSSAIAVLSIIILNLLLIPKYKAYGAAWATVGSFFIRFIIVYRFSQREYYIDYGWEKLIRLMVIPIVLYLVKYFIDSPSLMLSISVNIGFISLFSLIVYNIFMDASEKAFVRQLIQKPLSLSILLKQREK